MNHARELDYRYRLTEEQYAEIRNLYQQGRPVAMIAHKYNVSRSQIYNIVSADGGTRRREYMRRYQRERYWSKKTDGDSCEV